MNIKVERARTLSEVRSKETVLVSMTASEAVTLLLELELMRRHAGVLKGLEQFERYEGLVNLLKGVGA